ncbi:hypothetical protein OUZ56_003492 [Daphnia magna]|uniref:Uncharacterized protein n=1 Tax=Daphnia magna TaxID=35525 RepID=A0ABR0A9B6_9CRUS|nr:hypothetical protein OUZ56_003492 [Daphnia magna]
MAQMLALQQPTYQECPNADLRVGVVTRQCPSRQFLKCRHLKMGRVEGVMDTSGQGWLPVNVYVVVNGVGEAFLNVMLEIGVRF